MENYFKELIQNIHDYKKSGLNWKNNKLGNTYYNINLNLKNFIEFENNFNSIQGVYFIEDFYIGKSGNLNNRLAGHLTELCHLYTADNLEKSFKIIEILSIRKLKVKILSNNPKDEKMFIQEYSLKYPLLNTQFNIHSQLKIK
jgi:hypothetical protein